MADLCCVSLVLHYLNDILCKNYNYTFVFVKVILKTLLVPFFPDTVYNRNALNLIGYHMQIEATYPLYYYTPPYDGRGALSNVAIRPSVRP